MANEKVEQLLRGAEALRKKNEGFKLVDSVRKVVGQDNAVQYIVEFSGADGESLDIDRGVVMPDMGFVPEVGMLGRYFLDGSMNGAAELYLYDGKNKKLFHAKRSEGAGKDRWKVVPTQAAEPYKYYSVTKDTTSTIFVKVNEKTGIAEHLYSCSEFTGMFYENLDSKYKGKLFDELKKDPFFYDYFTKKEGFKPSDAKRFANVEQMGLARIANNGLERQ